MGNSYRELGHIVKGVTTGEIMIFGGEELIWLGI